MEQVLAHYPISVRNPRFLANAGGFSGAQLWQLETDRGLLCLRRWPTGHPTPERLSYIHGVLRHGWDQGFRQLPELIESRLGETVVFEQGHWWELTTWLAGRADFHRNPTRERLQAALECLAGFHLATSSFDQEEGRTISPGIRQRAGFLEDLRTGLALELQAAVEYASWEPLRQRGLELMDHYRRLEATVRECCAAALTRQVRLQPCLRDVWHDHVFFDGNRVTGLVDFGALNQESVSADLARLIGSLVADRVEDREFALQAYESVRPLDDAERDILQVFDRTAVVLSGLNWLNWVCREGRRFEDPNRILTRLDEWLQRLRAMR